MRQPIKVSTSFPGKPPPPPRLLNFWEYPTQLPGFDGNTFKKQINDGDYLFTKL